MRTQGAGWAVSMALAVVLAGCSRGDNPPVARPTDTAAADVIRVGAFNFPESRLVAELYAQALDAAGYPVSEVMQLGSREIVEPALEQGRVDLIAEYTGSALAFLRRDAAAASADVEDTHAGLVQAFADRGVTVAAAAPAQNQNAFAVSRETAEELSLTTISDLVPVAGDLVLGGPPECPQRHTCLAGLRDVYDLEFARFLSLPQTTHVAAALAAGEIDVGLLFTTDAEILAQQFVVLRDDRRLQPAENLVPVIRAEVVRRHGSGVVDVLDDVSARLTTARLAYLNLQLQKGDQPVDRLAGDWLAQNVVTP